MSVHTAPTQERRKFPRSESPTHLAITLVRPQGTLPASHINFSEGGMCLRLEEMLEVRSTVRLQVTDGASARARRAIECTGRVAWVIQRLDLRDMPPFVFDVGIELIDPPPMLRQFLTQPSGALTRFKAQGTAEKTLEPALIKGRQFTPRLERATHPPGRWHLVVLVESVPCFSGHYPSERAALAAWTQFKREQGKR